MPYIPLQELSAHILVETAIPIVCRSCVEQAFQPRQAEPFYLCWPMQHKPHKHLQELRF